MKLDEFRISYSQKESASVALEKYGYSEMDTLKMTSNGYIQKIVFLAKKATPQTRKQSMLYTSQPASGECMTGRIGKPSLRKSRV